LIGGAPSAWRAGARAPALNRASAEIEGRSGVSEMIRFVALAAALGLAAGMLLGGVALLLAAPAHAQTPAPQAAVGLECVPVLRRPSPPVRLEI
jgi:hypothetical protein